MNVKIVFKFRSLAAAGLFCLMVSQAQAQQGTGTAERPSPTPSSGSASAPSASNPRDLPVKTSEREIDESIPNDPALETIVAPYSAKVRELDAPLGKLANELTKSGIGGGSLGNFVVDAIRDRAQAKLGKPVLLAITNSGGLRKNQIAPGELKASDIWELLPFENALVTLDLTGEQLRRFLDIAVAHRDAQSGARITYKTIDEKQNKIVAVKLVGHSAEQDIDPQATYTIVTIDYLVKRGGDYSILQEAKNIRPLNLTLRDAVIDYVKAETAAGRDIQTRLDGRFRDEQAGDERQ